MPELPSQRQERFCLHAATGMTAEQAYVAAGYKPNRGNPSRLKGRDSIRQRIAEIQREISSKMQQVVVQHAVITRQYLVDALLENIEKSLGRQPVPVGAEMTPMYVYRGEVANNAIKMAGSEVNLFKDRVEVTSKMDFSDLSDDELLQRLRDETDALIRERAERAAENGEALLLERKARAKGDHER
jgi:phage terminase small subunit